MLNILKTLKTYEEKAKKIEEMEKAGETLTSTLKHEAEETAKNLEIIRADLRKYNAKTPTESDYIKEVEKARGNLREIHKATGFDFKAPFKLVKFYGPITPKKALDAIGAGENDYIFVLLLGSNRYRWTRDRLIFAELPKYGDFNAANVKRINNINRDGFGIDTVWSKGDFETMRKTAIYTYIFAQDKSLLKHTAPEQPASNNERYKIFDLGNGVADGRGNSWKYSKVRLQRTTDNGTKFYFSVSRTNNISDFIDKSGYLMEERRDDLKRRAAKIRADREKAAYTATDNTAKIEKLESIIKALKADIIKKLTEANTGDELNAIGKTIYCYDGLSGIFNDFKILKERDDKKEFASDASFSNYYNRITEKITKLY